MNANKRNYCNFVKKKKKPTLKALILLLVGEILLFAKTRFDSLLDRARKIIQQLENPKYVCVLIMLL